MKIILIAGKAGSGKKEVANYMKEYYIYQNKECAITSFSKYIVSFAKELTDWDGTDAKKPRDFMQSFGDTARSIDNNFFVNYMIKDLILYEKYVDVLVINDVRMPNEIEEIRKAFDDVTAIYVENQFGESKLTLEQQAHATETALEEYPDFDKTIANDKQDNLKDKVFKYLETL